MIAFVASRIGRRLGRDQRGAFAIETAFVAPVLAALTLGTFEVGSIVSRQSELQSAAQEGEAIALAINAGATADITEIEDIIEKSMDLPDDNVTITRFWRCDASNATVTDPENCPQSYDADGNETDTVFSAYITIRLTDKYVPSWTKFGLGSTMNFEVERTVMLA